MPSKSRQYLRTSALFEQTARKCVSPSKSVTKETTIRRALERFGYEDVALLTVEKGYRNEAHACKDRDGQTLNLILYKNEPEIVLRIKNANAVSNFLNDRGLPTRRSMDERILRLQSGRWRKYAALYDYLPGQTIPWEAYTQKHLKELGKAMGLMHSVLRDFDANGLPDVADEYVKIMRRMQRYFAQPGIRHALAVKLDLLVDETAFARLAMMLEASKRLSGQQALHMDFVRSNILFGDDASAGLAITGILDFEKTACGHPLFDIARTLAFLLVDCKYKSAEKVRKYFLYSGYRKRGNQEFRTASIRTKSNDIAMLEELLDVFLLYDFYKFLCHNPYEFLPQNAHFIRTRDLLLSRGLAYHSA
jgi:Ser/Thr protein kinase RdoA (MazF antagonist)